jgi:hypothetical protein
MTGARLQRIRKQSPKMSSTPKVKPRKQKQTRPIITQKVATIHSETGDLAISGQSNSQFPQDVGAETSPHNSLALNALVNSAISQLGGDSQISCTTKDPEGDNQTQNADLAIPGQCASTNRDEARSGDSQMSCTNKDAEGINQTKNAHLAIPGQCAPTACEEASSAQARTYLGQGITSLSNSMFPQHVGSESMPLNSQ